MLHKVIVIKEMLIALVEPKNVFTVTLFQSLHVLFEPGQPRNVLFVPFAEIWPV